MSAQFWPCPGCSRHVKRCDAVCPFCGAAASADIGPTRVLAGRLSRAALFAAGAVGTVVATTDCGGNTTLSTMYGSPCFPTPCQIETEDSSVGDGPSEVAADAADASAPTDSSTTSDDATSATTEPTDASSAADVPMGIVFYGAAIFPDE